MLPLSKETIEYGTRMAGLLLAIDVLYRAESGDDEGIVCLKLGAKGNDVLATAIGSYDEAYKVAQEMKQEALSLPEADRAVFYSQLSHALMSIIVWRTKGMSAEQKLSNMLHVPACPADDSELDALRKELFTLLTRQGYSGDLRIMIDQWQDRNRVHADEAAELFDVLTLEAWDRFEEQIFKLPFERDERMKIKLIDSMPFTARCNYPTRLIELNRAAVLTRPGIKHLVCHEGIPGHFIQFHLRETWADMGLIPPDNYFSIVNNNSSACFEGFGDNGPAALNWIDTDDDRITDLINRFRTALGTQSAWQLHQLGWEPKKVRDYMWKNALNPTDAWVDSRMNFMQDAGRSVMIWTYYCGVKFVEKVWLHVPQERKADFYTFAYRGLHSAESLALFK